ncbi:MAG: cytochrome c peroxidase [Nannocystaceae bacterium]
MRTRPLALATLSLTLLTACDDGTSTTTGGATTDGATTDGQDSDDPKDTQGSGSDSDGGSDPSGDDTTGGSDSGDASTGDDTTGDDSTTGAPDDGYPAEVLDYLDLPWPPHDYDDELPAHFRTPGVDALDNTPADNPLTNDGATLGRVLFYDVALSANDTVACASCHAQESGFTDSAQFSEGFAGELTGRNSMPIANARFYATGHFFWDERADTLEDQVLMPIQSEVEMGLTLDELVERVQSRPYYPYLFERAFGDPKIDSDRISRALAQFVRAIVSYRTPWDEGVAEVGNPVDDFPNYTMQENLGKALFFGPARCAPCHLGQAGPPPPPPPAPLPNQAIFMITTAANNGLDAELVVSDNGVGDITGDIMENGVFKSPSLRNVELTGPYMHDGRFSTLAEVIDHYDSGVQPHPNLDPRLRVQGGVPQQLNLDPQEKQALEAFLGTLTDDAMIADVRYADPFK